MRVLSIAGMLMWLWGIRGFAQDSPQITPDTGDAFGKILEFLYTIAHWVGQIITGLVQSLMSTILVLTEVAKRLARILVAIGWGPDRGTHRHGRTLSLMQCYAT